MLIVIISLKSVGDTANYTSKKTRSVAFMAFLKVIVPFQGIHGQSEEYRRKSEVLIVLKSQIQVIYR